MEARAGEVVALLGPNGAGKTSFFYILAGLIAVNKGEIKLNNELITNYPIFQRGGLVWVICLKIIQFLEI